MLTLAPVADGTGVEKLNLRRSPMNGTHLMVIALGTAALLGLNADTRSLVLFYGIRRPHF